MTAVLDESALQRFADGCAEVMAGQLAHLVACAKRPHISVHVIPAKVGLHIGLSGPLCWAGLRTAAGSGTWTISRT